MAQTRSRRQGAPSALSTPLRWPRETSPAFPKTPFPPPVHFDPPSRAEKRRPLRPANSHAPPANLPNQKTDATPPAPVPPPPRETVAPSQLPHRKTPPSPPPPASWRYTDFPTAAPPTSCHSPKYPRPDRCNDIWPNQ